MRNVRLDRGVEIPCFLIRIFQEVILLNQELIHRPLLLENVNKVVDGAIKINALSSCAVLAGDSRHDDCGNGDFGFYGSHPGVGLQTGNDYFAGGFSAGSGHLILSRKITCHRLYL